MTLLLSITLLLTIGYILSAVAIISIVVLYKLRDKKEDSTTQDPTPSFLRFEMLPGRMTSSHECEEPVQKKWNTEETIVAFYLAKYGLDRLGPVAIVSRKIGRKLSSFMVKVEIFEDLLEDNKTKNATKLDRFVFNSFNLLGRNRFYVEATLSMGTLLQ